MSQINCFFKHFIDIRLTCKKLYLVNVYNSMNLGRSTDFIEISQRTMNKSNGKVIRPWQQMKRIPHWRWALTLTSSWYWLCFIWLPWWRGMRCSKKVPQCLLPLFNHHGVVATCQYIIQAVNTIGTQTPYRHERAEAVMREACGQVFCIYLSKHFNSAYYTVTVFLTQCAFYTQCEVPLKYFSLCFQQFPVFFFFFFKVKSYSSVQENQQKDFASKQEMQLGSHSVNRKCLLKT